MFGLSLEEFLVKDFISHRYFMTNEKKSYIEINKEKYYYYRFYFREDENSKGTIVTKFSDLNLEFDDLSDSEIKEELKEKLKKG